MNESAPPPPGWYPDPQDDAARGGQGERYWDGSAWTGQTRGTGAGAGQPDPGASSSYQDPGASSSYQDPGAPASYGETPYGGAQYGGSPYGTDPYGGSAYGTPAYGGPYDGAPPQQAGNTLSIIGIICGAIAFVFCPILLGPAGIVLGVVGRSKGESLGTVAIVVGVAGLVVGMVISYFAFQAMYG